MANNQPTNAVVVIPDDSVNIPNPGVIISGTNTGAGSTLTDVDLDALLNVGDAGVFVDGDLGIFLDLLNELSPWTFFI